MGVVQFVFIMLMVSVIGLIVVSLLELFDTRIEKNKSMEDFFPNLIEWEVGDTITFASGRGLDGNVKYSDSSIVLFSKMGVHVYVWFSGQVEEFNDEVDDIDDYIDRNMDSIKFIPACDIKKNKSLEIRKRKDKRKNKIHEDLNYHQRLVAIQKEYKSLKEDSVDE